MPSLVKMLPTCDFTVACPTTRRSTICSLERPDATSTSTSRSRAVRSSSTFAADGPGRWTKDVARRDTVFAVLGGTGAYEGAAGTARLRARKGRRQDFTIALR